MVTTTATVETPLKAEDLGVRFRKSWALRQCSFVLRQGRITALVGPNGAGKSTLMAVAAGLVAPTEGRVEVAGTGVTVRGMHPAVGYLAQDKPLYRRFRVRDMVAIAADLNTRWDAARARRLIDEAGVSFASRVGTLSSGQRTRLALALVLARRPAVLLLDEPLADLDPLARVEVQQTLLTEVMDTGMSVLMSSHIVGEVQDTCDDLLLLRGGGIALDSSVERILGSYRVLIGPGTHDGDDTLARLPASGVVEIRRSARQTTVLLDGRPPMVPTGWSVAPATLEEVVMAHLRLERLQSPSAANGADQ